jgi:hypothetical protein
MANAYKLLARDNPGAVLTVLYTAPGSTEAVGTFIAANRAATAKKARFALSPLGAAIADDHYVFYDFSIPANDAIILNGVSLAATDLIRVYSEDNTVSFNFFGVEVT